MATFNVSGLVPPVFTPLNEDHTINFELIPEYARYLSKNGIKSLLVGGTTGEHMSISIINRKKVIDFWIHAKRTLGLHIMVQVGGAPLQDVLDLAMFCENNSVDSLLVLPELYFKPTSVTELLDYVELVSKAAPGLPVLYYHIPHMTNVQINMPNFVKAASQRIPNFKGIKFTSNDLSECAQVLRVLEDGQRVFLGADTLIAPAALMGITSGIGTTFNLFPKIAQMILDSMDKGDIVTASLLQTKLSLAIEAITAEGPWVPTMKAAMEIVSGIKVGPPSLPQRAIDADARNRIKDKLKSLNAL